MNNRVVYEMYYAFHNIGFSVLRFNFRGVGRSEGTFDQGVGELSDAAAALDYMQGLHPESRQCWVAGFSFGAWIAMQLLMRRPELSGFVSAAPPANMYDFSFLAPCPTAGLIVSGEKDRVVPLQDVEKLVRKLQTQRGITITHSLIPEANHFFSPNLDQLTESIQAYVKNALEYRKPVALLKGKKAIVDTDTEIDDDFEDVDDLDE